MVLKSFKPSIQEIAPLIKDAVSSGRDVRLTVTGYSMYPLLRDKTDDVILGSFEKISKYDGKRKLYISPCNKGEGRCAYHCR